jgi:outer membrane protein assembly factor BamB
LAALAFVLLASVLACADDWPTFRYDNARSGATRENLSVDKLGLVWVERAHQPPQTAWAGAADVDAFRKQRGLGDSRLYDPAFYPVIAGDCAYYGSTADDAVHCLDLTTGKAKWRYTTGGPIRVAPTVANGRVYVGSDDGQAYAIDAISGKLDWKFRPSAADTRIVNDGRIISLSPCRTGVLVEDGTAYFAMSMLPWNPTYLCAVNADNGSNDGPQHYVRQFNDGLTLEAALLATPTQIIAPQGRSGVVVFDRATGEQKTSLSGASTFAMLTPQGALVSGPFSRDIGLRGTSLANPQQSAWHSWGLEMAADERDVFLLSASSLAAVHAEKTDETRWSATLNAAVAFILAGDTLFVGCDGQVLAIDRSTGKQLWQHAVEGRAYGLAVGGGSLVVSTDEGHVYCFRPGATAVAQQVEDKAAIDQTALPELTPGLNVQLSVAPYVQFISPDQATVRWQTAQPSSTWLRYTINGVEKQFFQASPTTDHHATIDKLPHKRQVAYQVLASDGEHFGAAGAGNIDTFFNEATRALPVDALPYGEQTDEATAQQATQILELAQPTNGICLVFGATDGQLAWQLARQSALRVIIVDDQRDRIAALRDRWQQARVYGSRLSVVQVDSLNDNNLLAMLANLIIDEPLLATGRATISAQAAVRLLRPVDGTMYLPAETSEYQQALIAAGLTIDNADAASSPVLARRGRLSGTADWTEQYGTPSNAGYTGETLGGSRAASDLQVQWIGRPGPRNHADRQTRAPSPLCVDGRLFIQGQERIVALDAYNGVPLWSLELPGLERYDIPHDTGNWSANSESLFVALGNRCWQIATRTGQVTRRHEVIPGAKQSANYDWGYLALDGPLLVGSANLQNANSKGWWGGEFWRDDEVNTIAASDNLFAIDWATGKPVWTYTGGVIPNSSITLAAGKIFFVESRDEPTIANYAGRVMLHDKWPGRYLVAIDAKTGAKAWEAPLEIGGGQAIFSMAWADDKLVICSSGNSKYYIQAISAQDGSPLWQQTIDWVARGHGAHYSRPVIVEGKVFVRPFALDLATGTLLPERMPGGGCGTYCASRDALIFRSGDVSLWAPENEQLSGFSRLRPGCWLSTIPAGGLLLSPEAGGGCSCGGWMETSIAFAPAEFPPPSFGTRDRHFIDEKPVELFTRVPGSQIRYTLDGSEPSETSPLYTSPILLSRAATVKAATYFQPSANDQPTVRSTTVTASFVRQYPSPAIADEVTTFTDTLTVELKNRGTTGTIYYTLDDSEPTVNSSRYDSPLQLKQSADLVARTIWVHPDGEVSQSDPVRQKFYHVVKTLPQQANVNFQHPGMPVPEGYLVDSGQTFRPQPSGYFYGWTRNMRDRLAGRGDAHDPLRNTFIHCMADTAWEVEVENGRYEVTVAVGETFYGQERATIFVEGIEFCKDLQLPRKEVREITHTVDVQDGRLTLTSHEDNRINKATRLNHLRLQKLPPQ